VIDSGKATLWEQNIGTGDEPKSADAFDFFSVSTPVQKLSSLSGSTIHTPCAVGAASQPPMLSSPKCSNRETRLTIGTRFSSCAGRTHPYSKNNTSRHTKRLHKTNKQRPNAPLTHRVHRPGEVHWSPDLPPAVVLHHPSGFPTALFCQT
jgi:hypothetical protein